MYTADRICYTAMGARGCGGGGEPCVSFALSVYRGHFAPSGMCNKKQHAENKTPA
jgi:hypothetical protein